MMQNINNFNHFFFFCIIKVPDGLSGEMFEAVVGLSNLHQLASNSLWTFSLCRCGASVLVSSARTKTRRSFITSLARTSAGVSHDLLNTNADRTWGDQGKNKEYNLLIEI